MTLPANDAIIVVGLYLIKVRCRRLVMLIKKIAQKKWLKKAAAIAAIVCTLSAAPAMAPKAEAFG